MEIKYLKKAQKTRRIRDEINEPAPLTHINELLIAVDKPFPKAYLEFLYICGKNANMLSDMDQGYNDNILEIIERQQLAREVLEEENFVIERDYWVIADLDGCQQFVFFYFDEGDNPPIYVCDRGYWEDDEVEKGYEFVRMVYESFSEYIEGKIKYRKSVGY